MYFSPHTGACFKGRIFVGGFLGGEEGGEKGVKEGLKMRDEGGKNEDIRGVNEAFLGGKITPKMCEEPIKN